MHTAYLKTLNKYFSNSFGILDEKEQAEGLHALFVEEGTNMIDLNFFALALRQKRAKCLRNVNYAAPWKKIETLFLSNITTLCLFLINLTPS